MPEVTQQEAVKQVVRAVRAGQPLVPLLGAGISIEAGVPPLSEVTRYLAKTKAYIRYKVFTNRPPSQHEMTITHQLLLGPDKNPLFREHPGDHLHQFGWPDPQVLNWSVWHWLRGLRRNRTSPVKFPKSLDLLVDAEILDALRQIDQGAATLLRQEAEILARLRQIDRKAANQVRSDLGLPPTAAGWSPVGSYWKILLSQLTRSSPDLIDTLFQRLTRNRTPATAHRYLAFLTPVLRLRLFLTINFDTLLEDALRIEGLRPTVYEVTDGLSIPHSKLVQEGLSVVKLHGGAYGLLVGDRLDSPLDEETRARFRDYLPENLILLALGIGGWDQRVLDMVELAHQRNGQVWWLHFEEAPPLPLQERFAANKPRNDGEKLILPEWLHTVRVQDPGAFLRDVYVEYKDSYPSSSQPFQVCDLRPVLIEPDGDKESAVKHYQRFDGRLVIFEDDPDDYGLGAASSLARLVAKHAATHLPVWVDVETKFTVEDVVVDVIQQLRRYDPGLPPEILVVELASLPDVELANPRGGERASPRGPKRNFRKVIRRLFAALARGRYILAFNGVQSFGRSPTKHHFYEQQVKEINRERDAFSEFLRQLVNRIERPAGALPAAGNGKMPESLGLLDSILAFSLDHPAHADRPSLRRVFLRDKEKPVRGLERIKSGPCKRKQDFAKLGPAVWKEQPHLVLLTAMRRRRSVVALHRLLPKYLALQPGAAAVAAGPPEDGDDRPPEDRDPPDAAAVEAARKARREHREQEIDALVKEGYLWRLEGGDYWMSRKLRNDVYDTVHHRSERDDDSEPLARFRALAILVFVHRDLAQYHHREIYVATQDVMSLLEELYHRASSLRHLKALEELAEGAPRIDDELRQWLGLLAAPAARWEERPIAPASSRAEEQRPADPADSFGSLWSGARPIVGPDGQLDRDAMAAGRCQDLRALRELLQQEREALLSRVPSVTLQGWVKALKEDLAAIVPGQHDGVGSWREELRQERARLEELLDDIRIEVLQDRMETLKIVVLRCADLEQLLGAAGRERIKPDAKAPGKLRGHDSAKEHAGMETIKSVVLRCADLAQLLATGKGRIKPDAKALGKLRGQDSAKAHEGEAVRDADLWHFRGRAVRAMADLTRALQRGVWATREDRKRARLDETLEKLLGFWLPKVEGGQGKAVLGKPIPPELLDLKLVELRLAADQALSTQSPWKVKGRGPQDLHRQREAAHRALDLSERGLRILDSIREEERTLRSYFHSLKGRALYLSSDPRKLDANLDKAYREFDLARAALSEATARERQALAVSLLRQAECLMVHSDGELTRWVYEAATLEHEQDKGKDKGKGKEPDASGGRNWSNSLSLEGQRKLKRPDAQPTPAADGASSSARPSPEEDLLCLSLANWSPQRLSDLERAARTREDQRLALTNTLGIMRSRLAAARELLDRVEVLLESSRREVEWWACLFQLRVQLAVESLLLLLSGPSSAAGVTTGARVPQLVEDSEMGGRRQFIHRFQDLLTQGLMAVRQGLDVLLPGDSDRQGKWIERDELLNHLLRLWVELMVCGAYATELSQESRSADLLDDNQREYQMKSDSSERWKQWRYLNWLAGLVSLPDCPELEAWFGARDWTIGPPSLASRGRALGRMDLALAVYSQDQDRERYPVGAALKQLRRVLLDDTRAMGGRAGTSAAGSGVRSPPGDDES